MGGCLFVAATVSRLDFSRIVKAIWPFIIVEMIVLTLVIYFPGITMFVPKQLGLAV